MKKDFLPPFLVIFAIIVGEMTLYIGDVLLGLVIHLLSLLAIIFKIIFGDLDIKIKNILQGLILVILLRAVNLSIPQFFTTTIQYSMIYGIMFIPIYMTIKNQNISAKDLGINFKKFHIYLPIAIILGSIIAVIEYKISNPIHLIEDVNIPNIIIIAILMFIFIGPVEEIIFRSILLSRVEKLFDPKYGILLSGGIFGIMHMSYGIIEILFTTIFGIILGDIFQKTRSLPFIVVTHGTANVILFVVLSKSLITI